MAMVCASGWAQTGTNISRYPRTNIAGVESIFLFSNTNVSTTTSFGITASNLFYQITNSLSIAAGDAGGTNARQFGSLNLTNWSLIPTGEMANVVSTTFLTNWTDAVSNYVRAATNSASVTNWINSRQPASANLTNWSLIPTGEMANVVSTTFLTNWANAVSNYVTTATNSPQVTNWITTRQPADTDLTNWSLIPTGAMANVVAADFLTNWANAVSNYVTASTNAPQVTNWITTRQPADTDLTNWSLIPTGAMANVVSTTFLTNWANAISNYVTASTNSPSVTNWINSRQPAAALLSNLVSNPYTGYTNAIAAGTNIVLTTAAGTTTLNVPTDFTNILYVNRDHNLSSILTNAPNNTKIWVGTGDWTNTVSHLSALGQLGMFHLANRTNVEIESVGASYIWNTNRGDGFVLSNCSNIRIKGMGWQGWRITNAILGTSFAAVVVSRCRDVVIEKCRFLHSGNDGIQEDGSQAFQSTNIVVEGNYFFGGGNLYSDLSGDGYDGKACQMGSHWTFRNNQVIEYARGAEFYGSVAAGVPVVAGSVVEGNYFENMISRGVYNFHTNNVGFIIRNNRFYYNDGLRRITTNAAGSSVAIGIGIVQNGVVEGNYISGLMTGNPVGNSGCAIQLTLSSLGFGVNNLVIRNNTITNSEAGIVVFNGTDKVNGVIISGNQIYKTYFWGILAAASDLIIENNLIVDPEQFGDAGQAAIGIGIFGTACTNIVVRNNVLRRSPGATVQDGIKIDAAARGVRLWDNTVDAAFSPRFTGNGTAPVPNIDIEAITGTTTNFFVARRTNGTVAWALDPQGFVLAPTDLTNRAAAPTNYIASGADNFGGMSLPNWTDHNGLTAALQPFLGHEHIYWLSTRTGATIGEEGVASVTNGGTTITHTTPVESQAHMVNLASPATSNGCASAFMSAYVANAGAHNGSSKIGGYFFTATWCSTNLIGQVVGGGAPRTFVGLTARASEDYTNMVVTTNATGQYVGLMVDTKQSTNIFITSRDASAEFRTNTEMAFIATNIYKFYLFNAPTSRFVGWRLDDAFTGGTRSGWFSNNVPTNFMTGGIITKNGTNRAHDVRFSRLYLQAPLAPPR